MWGVPRGGGNCSSCASYMSVARSVWFSSLFGLRLSGSIRIPLKDWLPAVLETKEVDFELACLIMWGIWQERNSWVWRGFKALPMVVWQKVSSWLSAF